MTPKHIATYRLDDYLLQGLRNLAQREGITASEAVRQALEAGLKAKGIPVRRLSFSERRARAEGLWEEFVDDLEHSGNPAEVSVPAGLSAFIADGSKFGDLDQAEFDELLHVTRQLGRPADALVRAWKAVHPGRTAPAKKRG